MSFLRSSHKCYPVLPRAFSGMLLVDDEALVHLVPAWGMGSIGVGKHRYPLFGERG
jgi:hypothetical protein